jgi:endonuclease/exonuclease/phosphatase (EEP) superfamily protein YafD
MSASRQGAAAPQERRFSRKLMWLVCGATVVATVLALFSRWHWFAELFSHFRLYYLLLQAVLIMVFINTRRYLWLVATVLLALPNAWYVMPYLLPLLPGQAQALAAPAGPQVIVVNLGYRNTEHQRVLDYVNERGADVVVLSEYTPAWDAALTAGLSGYPHALRRPRPDPFGMAVYSRRPFIEAEALDLGAEQSENIRLNTLLGGREINLFAVHLYPPTSPERAARRRRQLHRLAAEVSAAPVPRLVVGDLNLTPFSPHFHELLGRSGLLDARQAQGLHVTWPSLPLPLWIPIDHALADPGSGVADVRIGPAIGSDHYPLEIVLTEIG